VVPNLEDAADRAPRHSVERLVRRLFHMIHLAKQKSLSKKVSR
jgi:hypothetical protein